MIIRPAKTSEDLAAIADLFREYADSLNGECCVHQIDKDLADLPGAYGPPHGALFLALDNDQPIGCVALRRFENGTCEMKRLYVRPAGRGKGLGRVLTVQVIQAARQLGYRRICLDTLGSMKAAMALYESLGFYDVPPYRTNPNGHVRFMELRLHVDESTKCAAP